MKTLDISPCPCCGGLAQVVRIHNEHLVECAHPDCPGPERGLSGRPGGM